MTALALFPVALGLVVIGGFLTWPVAHRAGRTSANKAAARDRAEIGRILGGLHDDGQDLPRQYGTIAEHTRRQELLAVASRPRHACDIVAATPLSYHGRHFAAAGEVTQEFLRITRTSLADLATWCTLCEGGHHGDCPGCACPCGTAVLPVGVDGYAIAGRTR